MRDGKIWVTDNPFYGQTMPPEHAATIAYIGLVGDAYRIKPHRVCVCTDVEAYARQLVRFFRTCKKAGVTRIYCQPVPEIGLGRALMDRIRRAAEGEDIPT